jgi:hypothetical protein
VKISPQRLRGVRLRGAPREDLLDHSRSLTAAGDVAED